jgi:hypothetical protein
MLILITYQYAIHNIDKFCIINFHEIFNGRKKLIENVYLKNKILLKN